VRRKALHEAAKALEADAATTTTKPELSDATRQLSMNDDRRDSGVMAHVTSQHVPSRYNVIEFPKKSGSHPGRFPQLVEPGPAARETG
jgi:hypothetical protein